MYVVVLQASQQIHYPPTHSETPAMMLLLVTCECVLVLHVCPCLCQQQQLALPQMFYLSWSGIFCSDFMWDEYSIDASQRFRSNTTTYAKYVLCSAPDPASLICVLEDRGARMRLYSRTFGPKHDACVCSCPSLIRYGSYALFLGGQPREYKRPSLPQINAQYQLSFLRLTRFRTSYKSIQNV